MTRAQGSPDQVKPVVITPYENDIVPGYAQDTWFQTAHDNDVQLQLAPLSYSELLYMSDRHTCSLCPLIPEQPPLLVSGAAHTIGGSRGLRANRQ